MKLRLIALCLAVAAGTDVQLAFAQSKPVVLITDEESQLAAAPSGGDLSFRAGVSRGPAITVVSPKPGDGLKSPFHLQLKFEGRGGAQIDPDSLKLTYAKSHAVDLTSRVKAYVQPAGMDVTEASVPPGEHTIRAEIKDKDGRAGFTTFTIKVSK